VQLHAANEFRERETLAPVPSFNETETILTSKYRLHFSWANPTGDRKKHSSVHNSVSGSVRRETKLL